tara:strand:- start:87 stop:188 length:102 start_codon:yes stop_codon:yes gene_type:complete
MDIPVLSLSCSTEVGRLATLGRELDRNWLRLDI